MSKQKVLVCFAGPLDGARLSVSSYMKKVYGGQGGIYYRKKFTICDRELEALVHGSVDISAIDLEIICGGSVGDRNDHDDRD